MRDLGARLLCDVSRLQETRPARHRVLGDGHAIAGVKDASDASASAVILHLFSHAERVSERPR